MPTAILFDLGLGSSSAHPTAEMAYEAAQRASDSVDEGTVGAGAGATVGKLLSVRCATKGGLGSWGEVSAEGLAVGAIVALNSFGDVYDPDRGALIAGARRAPESLELINMSKQILAGHMRTSFGKQNTTLVAVATNARLEGSWLRRVAWWASDALSSIVRPAFTAVDGDVVICLSSEEVDAEPHRVGLMAQRVVTKALIRAITTASPLHGLPSASELTPLPVKHTSG